jgi:hypothetical protein
MSIEKSRGDIVLIAENKMLGDPSICELYCLENYQQLEHSNMLI